MEIGLWFIMVLSSTSWQWNTSHPTILSSETETMAPVLRAAQGVFGFGFEAHRAGDQRASGLAGALEEWRT